MAVPVFHTVAKGASAAAGNLETLFEGALASSFIPLLPIHALICLKTLILYLHTLAFPIRKSVVKFTTV